MAIEKNPDDTRISSHSGGDSKMGSPDDSNDPASNESIPLSTLHVRPGEAILETLGPSSLSVGSSNPRRRWRKFRRWQEEERETGLLGRRDHGQPDRRVASGRETTENKVLPAADDRWTDQASKESIPLSPLDAAIPSEDEVAGAATLVVAEVPCSAQMAALFDNVCVLKTVRGILNKLTPEKFDTLKGLLSHYRITSADILELREELPEQEIRDKDRLLKLLRLVGLLFNKKMVPEETVHDIVKELLGTDPKSCPAEEKVEAICQLFSTIGRELDRNPESRSKNDEYFKRLEDLSTNPQLAPCSGSIHAILALRKWYWIKQDEKSFANWDQSAPAPQPQPADVKLSRTELRCKTNSLLQEYFSRRDLKEALACVEKLKSPSYHSEVVKHAVSLGLENIPPLVELVAELVEYLFKNEIVSHEDMLDGLLGFAALLDDVGIRLPKAPTNFGEILRRLVQSGALASEAFLKIRKKVTNDNYAKSVAACVPLELLLPPPRNNDQMIVMQVKWMVKKLYKMALMRMVNFPASWPKMMPKIQKERALKECVKKLLKIANRYELQGLYQDDDALEELQNLWLDEDEELNRKPD